MATKTVVSMTGKNGTKVEIDKADTDAVAYMTAQGYKAGKSRTVEAAGVPGSAADAEKIAALEAALADAQTQLAAKSTGADNTPPPPGGDTK